MKGIIKVRSFDSLKKLNYKRAKGKKKNIIELNKQTFHSIITLEKLKLLTPELLWDLIERRKYLYIEQEKLNYVIERREKSLPLSEDDLKGYINRLGNIKIAVLRIPYEIRIIPKYRTYITKREQDESNIIFG
jgi:hypothetical protein